MSAEGATLVVSFDDVQLGESLLPQSWKLDRRSVSAGIFVGKREGCENLAPSQF